MKFPLSLLVFSSLIACCFAVTDPPAKYVKVNGITKLNPEYTAWQKSHGEKPTTLDKPNDALPVVSNMDDYIAYNEATTKNGGQEKPLAPAMDATFEIFQDKQVADKVGLKSDEMIDKLGQVFAKYEIPIGFMNKLLEFDKFDSLEFIIDDSGSMGESTDMLNERGGTLTRFQEAQSRLKSMMEILAYVPTPKITIRFLNRADKLVLQHKGEDPAAFISNVYRQIDDAFRASPSGRTPFRERIDESFKSMSSQKVARYFFGDGEPNGGNRDVQQIHRTIVNRHQPQDNPVTFLSCTNDDSQVEWMKEIEEVAPFCAEYDDFQDERDEVRRDQGDVLPFTKGFHLVAQLVGAMNPDDIDAMDESVPFTKYMLDNLLGVEYSREEYRHYFDGFVKAQKNRKIESKADEIKKNMDWNQHFDSFTSTELNKNIPVVQEFKRKLSLIHS